MGGAGDGGGGGSGGACGAIPQFAGSDMFAVAANLCGRQWSPLTVEALGGLGAGEAMHTTDCSDWISNRDD